MTLEDNVIGLPAGTIPEEGTTEHESWLRHYIIETFHKTTQYPQDRLLRNHYAGVLLMYNELYMDVWIEGMER